MGNGTRLAQARAGGRGARQRLGRRVTREQWERLKTLFHGALDQAPKTRDEWLMREAGDDEMLAREAAALVAAHDTAEGFLEAPATVDPADIVDPDFLEAGTRIGPYEIERVIGRGGMGVVYCARDVRLDRRVALKALPPVHDGDAGLRERLRREARAAATISHPAVATVYALEEIDGRLFIASELVEGHTLRSEIERAPLDRSRALAVAADIARALCAAHDAGVIHRDLKPENVLIASGGAVKVVDFGIAQVESAKGTRLTHAGAVVGTPAYMPPEQLLGGATDARADIYALGVVLTEMLTGLHPLMPGRPPMPVEASDIAWRCIQTDPDQRYQSAHELLSALERELAHQLDPAAQQVTSGGARSSWWWWEFHQAVAALVYGVMTWPAWIARSIIGGKEGNAIFVAILASAVIAATLRLHLWFTSRFYPAELVWARVRAEAWVFAADCVFTATLVLGGVLIGESRPGLAVVLIAVGIGSTVAFLLIEPATARAAFRPRPRL
jgi:hypothetical protein